MSGLGENSIYGKDGVIIYQLSAEQTTDITFQNDSEYLYFPELSMSDLSFFRDGNDLHINADGFGLVARILGFSDSSSSFKGIFDKNTDVTALTALLDTDYSANELSALLTEMESEAGYNNDVKSLNPDVSDDGITYNLIFPDTGFVNYSLDNVSSNYEINVIGEDDLSKFHFYKEGSNLVLLHSNNESKQNGSVILNNYFELDPAFALDIINGQSLSQYTSITSDYQGLFNYQGDKITIFDENIDGTLYGTALSDEIVNYNKHAFAGKGNDIIYSRMFDDSNTELNGGEGNDIIILYSDHDKTTESGSSVANITLTNDESLTLIYQTAHNTEKLKTEMYRSGNDGIIIYKYQTDRYDENVENIIGKSYIEDKIIVKNLLKTKAANVILKTYGYDGEDKFEFLSAENLLITRKAMANVTGGRIKGTKGNDTITGTPGNDIITALDGDDIIYNSAGTDNITGGKGVNKIIYDTKNFGTDTITLTKGENLTIDLSYFGIDSANKEELDFEFKKNDFLIKTKEGTITIKNFASKDVTNNGTKTKPDSSSVLLKVSESETINLRTKVYSLNVSANYTGNWHNENITAVLEAPKNPKTNAGISIDAKSGNNTITGSQYNDTITAGTGEDTFMFSAGSGSDVIKKANANDEIIITGYSYDDVSLLKFGNDLILKYNDDDSARIEKYFTSRKKINKITLDDGEQNIASMLAVKKYALTGKGSIAGTKLSDTIYGSDSNDNIRALDGNDTIYGSKGNDKITGGKGTNKLIYNTQGFGSDTITLTKSECLTIDLSEFDIDSSKKDELDFEFKKSDLVIKTKEGNITLKSFASKDVTNNSTRTAINTSFVLLKISDTEEIDLRNKVYDIDVKSNYTGNWHNENINANTAGTGVTINAKNGNNNITGSKYNDKITGGDGNDTIDGGAGKNTLKGGKENDTYINSGLNNFDTIDDAAGDNDQIIISNTNKDDLILFFDLKIDKKGKIINSGSKNMYIKSANDIFNKNAGITVKNNFQKTHSIEKIQTADNYVITDDKINILRQNIAAWLYENNFASIQSILDSGIAADITALTTELNKADWQSLEV